MGGLLGASAAQGTGDVGVDVELPAVTRVEFDPRDPPPDMPRTDADGLGVCRNVFEIEARVASSIEPLTPTTVRAYPQRIDVTTRLKVTIYTPFDSPPKLIAHEEGHRMIGEHYYGNAAAAAREAATSLLGLPFEASGVDRATAEQAVGELVLAALKDSYMRGTQARSAAANARYDEITAHGLDAIAEADAVAGAIVTDP